MNRRGYRPKRDWQPALAALTAILGLCAVALAVTAIWIVLR